MSLASELALRFAAAIEGGRWQSAMDLLAPHCEYLCRGSTMTGPKRIVGSYRQVDEWVRASFEQVRYSHFVAQSTDSTATLRFRDQMERGPHALDFRCEQRIEVDVTGRIVRIEHVDLPGEREKADRFNAACGVERPR